jgi:hypothetical protein
VARKVTLSEVAETSRGVLEDFGDVPLLVRDSNGDFERVASVGYSDEHRAYVIEAERR